MARPITDTLRLLDEGAFLDRCSERMAELVCGVEAAGKAGTRMMDEPKPVEMRVKQHGAVRVNAASVYREAPGIVCIYVDLHSKRVEPPMAGSGDGEPPTLYFTPGDHALHLDKSKPRDSLTAVEFPEYVGWNVFACNGPASYTLGVVLVAPEESA